MTTASSSFVEVCPSPKFNGENGFQTKARIALTVPEGTDCSPNVPSSVRSLPIDLIRPIVEYLAEEFSTLYALSQTCYAIQFEAERMLYRCMRRYDWKMQIGFLMTLVCCPARAPLVRILHILPRHFQQDPILLHNCLTMAFQGMVNLKEFIDGCFQNSLRYLVEEVPSKLELQHFSFTDASEHGESDSFFRFLGLQPSLQRLHVREDPDLTVLKMISILPADPKIVPRLQYLRGSLATLKLFLPERKITILDWEPSNRMAEADAMTIVMPRIGPYLNRVKYLCLRKYAYHIKRPPLDMLSRYMESLEYLDLPGIQGYEISQLNLFPSLHGLSLTGLPSPNSTQPDYTLSDFLIPITRRCPQITAIIVEIRTTLQTQSNREFQIWTPLDVEDEMANPPIYQVPISDLAFHNIFELLPV